MGLLILASLGRCIQVPFEAPHACWNSKQYVGQFAGTGADHIAYHLDAAKRLKEIVGFICTRGTRPAIALRSETPAEVIWDSFDLMGKSWIYFSRR